LEPPGTIGIPRILLDVPYPQYLKCMAALVCRSPPAFIHFIPMLWGVLEWMWPTPRTYALPFSPFLPTTGNYWNLYDPRILLDLSYPQYLCVIIFPTIRNYWSHLEPIRPQDSPRSALTPLPMHYHFPYYWKLWNLYDPRILLDVPCPPVPEMYGCTDAQVPSPFHTWQTENQHLVLGSW